MSIADFASSIPIWLRRHGIRRSSCWSPFDSAWHWLAFAASSDWHQRLGIDAAEFARRIANVVFAGKAGFGVPKVLLVEDDIDITNLGEFVWVFATRAHPAHGEIYFPSKDNVDLYAYLEEQEKGTRSTKVVHNCFINDRYPPALCLERPLLENAWPAEIQQKVLSSVAKVWLSIRQL